MKDYTYFYGSMLLGVTIIFLGNLLRNKYSIAEFLFFWGFYLFAVLLSMLIVKEISLKGENTSK